MSSLGLPHNVVQKLLELTLGESRETLEIQVREVLGRHKKSSVGHSDTNSEDLNSHRNVDK